MSGNKKNRVSKVRASLIELFSRVIPINKDKDKEVYWNGEDNLYPNEIARVISQSPTGSRSAKLLSKFISGRGVADAKGELIPHQQLPIINKKKGYNITDIISMISKDISEQGGCWVHVGYGFDEDGNIVTKNPDILPYIKCRKYKDDDEGNNGKVYVKDFECKDSITGGAKNNEKWYYPFNPDADVVKAQIMADAGADKFNPDDIKTYRGQVLYINSTPQYQYALSRFDPVFNDMDTEYRVSLYANTESRRGFLGKTIFVTAGLDEEKADEVKSDLSKFMGAEGSADMYHLDVEHTEDITKIIHTIQLKSQFDDKQFELTQKRIRTNILGSANNAPEALVFAGESALFGTNAEYYEGLKKFYDEQVIDDQDLVEKSLSMIGFGYRIVPITRPIQVKIESQEEITTDEV